MSKSLPTLSDIQLSAGIEELLKEGGRVLDEKIFTTKHLGRTIDFLITEANSFFSKSQNAEILQYRVRHILEVSIFNGWLNATDEVSRYVELSVGWDVEKIVVSSSFYVSAEVEELDLKNMEGNCSEKNILQFITKLKFFSDGIIVKFNSHTRRMTLLCFIDAENLSIEGNAVSPEQVYLADAKSPPPLDIVSNVDISSLADQNIDLFSKSEEKSADEAKTKKVRAPSVAKKNDSRADEKPVHVVSSDSLSEQMTNIVSGQDFESTLAENIVISDEGEIEGSLDIMLDTIKAEVMPFCSGITKEQFDLAFDALTQKLEENFSQSVHHLVRLKTIPLLSQASHYKEQIKALNSKITTLQRELDRSSMVVARPSSVEVVGEDGKVVSSEVDIENTKTFRDKVEAIEVCFKKKELDFSAKENLLKEKLRTSEEKGKQQDFAFNKTKDLLSKALDELEKHKLVKAGGAKGEDPALKLMATEKLLSGAKENIERLQKRVDDVQKKWQDEFSSRAQLQKSVSDFQKQIKDLERQVESQTSGNSKHIDAELKQTKIQKDRFQKVIDEQKNQISELNKKLVAALAAAATATTKGPEVHEKKSASVQEAELKLKLDRAQKLSKALKDENDKYRKKFDELRHSEIKLKNELAKAQNQIKAHAKTAAPSKR